MDYDVCGMCGEQEYTRSLYGGTRWNSPQQIEAHFPFICVSIIPTNNPLGKVRRIEVVGPSSRRTGKAVHFVTAHDEGVSNSGKKKQRKQDLGEGAGIYHDHDVEW